MNKKKVIGLALTSIIILGSTGLTAAASSSKKRIKIVPISSSVKKKVKVITVKEEKSQDNLSAPVEASSYISYTGKIKNIEDYKAIEGSKIILLEGEDGQEANFIISKDTYSLDDVKLEKGAVITGYYNANAPMIMIYPPQYNIEVVAVPNTEKSVKVSSFDKDLVTSDNSLKLNISSDTEIVTQDGKAYKGSLKNKKLVVVYGPTTRSIPALTTPYKVVVLSEKKN